MKDKKLMIPAAISKVLFLILLAATSSFGQSNAALDSVKNSISEQHKMLARANGTWTGEASLWFAPDKPPIKSTSKLTNHMDANGRFQISEIEGNVTGAGQPFTGVRITGYDAVRKVFTRAMLQDLSPGVVMEGAWDESKKSFSMPFKQVDASGKERSLKEVYTFVDADTEILEIYDTKPAQGKEFRILEVVWRRNK